MAKKKIKLGDKLMLPITESEKQEAKKGILRPCTVVYVHPQYRFFMAEFPIEHLGMKCTIRECYPIDLSQTRFQRKLRSIIAAGKDKWRLN